MSRTLVITATILMSLATLAPADDATAEPATSTSTSTSRPASSVQGRRMIWDRTRIAVDRAQRDAILRNVIRAEEQKALATAEAGEALAPQLESRLEIRRVPDVHPALVKAAYLGVASSAASPVLRRQLRLPEGVGLVIEFVEPGSPADAAGVQPYDLVVRLNEQILVNAEQLAVLVRTFDPGTHVKLAVVREQERFDLAVRLGEREMKPLAGWTADGRGRRPGLVNLADDVLGEPRDAWSDYKLVYDADATPNPDRAIAANDLVLVKLKDVEAPGVATVTRAVVREPSGTITLPRLSKPVPAVGCTPVQLENSVREMYRSLGVGKDGCVDVFVCPAPPSKPAVEKQKVEK